MYCARCGSRISGYDNENSFVKIYSCKSCGDTAYAKKCTICKTYLPFDVEYCINCGEKVKKQKIWK